MNRDGRSRGEAGGGAGEQRRGAEEVSRGGGAKVELTSEESGE